MCGVPFGQQHCGRAAVPTKLHAPKAQNTPRLSTGATDGSFTTYDTSGIDCYFSTISIDLPRLNTDSIDLPRLNTDSIDGDLPRFNTDCIDGDLPRLNTDCIDGDLPRLKTDCIDGDLPHL